MTPHQSVLDAFTMLTLDESERLDFVQELLDAWDVLRLAEVALRLTSFARVAMRAVAECEGVDPDELLREYALEYQRPGPPDEEV